MKSPTCTTPPQKTKENENKQQQKTNNKKRNDLKAIFAYFFLRCCYNFYTLITQSFGLYRKQFFEISENKNTQ